jgi:hypothetical protein
MWSEMLAYGIGMLVKHSAGDVQVVGLFHAQAERLRGTYAANGNNSARFLLSSIFNLFTLLVLPCKLIEQV